MARTAGDLHRRAVELSIRGNYGGALRAIDRALTLTDDPDLRARLAGTRAVALQRTGAPALAERVCREALRTAGISAHTRAVLEGQLGALAMYGGRLDEAARSLTRAVSRLDGDPVAAARIRMNRSLVHMQRGRLSDAAADLQSAAETFEDQGLATDAAQARHNLGYTSLLRGDLVAALQEMLAARPGAASSPVAAAVGDLDRAEVLRDAGLTTEAERILARTAGVFGSRRMPQSRAEAELSLARSLLPHDPRAARRVARAATERFDAVGNAMWAARARGLRVRAELAGGRVLRRGERAPEPRRVPTAQDVDDAASALERLGLRNEGTAVRLAYERWRATHGADGDARMPRVPARASIEVRLLAADVRAVRAVSEGRTAQARRHAARGLDLLARWQSDFGSLDLQTSVAMHGNDLILTGLESAVRSGRPDVVFDWSERARHLSLQVVPLRPPPDLVVAEQLSELRRLRADDPAWLDSARAAELRESVRERQWSATGSATFDGRASLGQVRAQLDDETAFISFVYSESGLTALVVASRGARLVALPAWPEIQRALAGLRADLDMAAAMRATPMAGVVGRSLDARLAALSRALLDGPLRVAGEARRLAITVPGALSGIPWSMLPGLRGRALSLAPSATRWVRSRSEKAPAPRAAVVVAGPRVARGEEEVEVAASAWSSPVLARGDDASVAAVTELAQQADVLHIAAHGRHSGDNPLFSGLELADGTLFGYDIDLIPDVPQTVVLSACEVGRSSVRWGEEAIGMTRVWLHAGTRCVIASPVVVADDDACELLGAVHAGLANGEAPAEALAAASVRTGIRAPFQVYGTGF